MQFAILIYEPDEKIDARQEPEGSTFLAPWRSYHRALLDADVYRGGSPLEKADDTATTIRVRGGERHVQDGPFADTKEQLGGFILIEVPTLDAAIEWASRCPAAAYGAVEVRPTADSSRICSPDLQGLPPRD